MPYSDEERAYLRSLLPMAQAPDVSAPAPNPLASLSPQDQALISGAPRPKPGQKLVGPGAPPSPPPFAENTMPGHPGALTPEQIAAQNAIEAPLPQQTMPAGQGLSHSTPNFRGYQPGPGPSSNPTSTAPPDMSKVVTPKGLPQAQQGGAEGTPPQAPPAPRPAPVVTHPAGWVETMAPAQREMLEAGRRQEQAGIEAGGKSQADFARAQADALQEARRNLQRPDPEQAELERQKQATLDHYEQLRQAYEKGPREVNPNHYFASKSAPERIVLSIADALGAAGAVLGHTENFAGRMIEHAIDQDIHAQEVNIENRRNGLQDARGLLADKWRMFGDKEKGIAAAKQAQYQYAMMEVEEMSKRAGSQQAQANAQTLLGQMKQKDAAFDAQHNVYKAASQTGGPLSEKQQLELDKLRAETEHIRGETAHLGEKRRGGAADKEQVKEDARASILRDVAELYDLNRRAGVTGLWDPAARARAESLRTQIALHYNPAHGIQRVGSQAELENLRNTVVPSLTHPGFPSGREARLGALREEFQQDDEAPPAPKFNAPGFTPLRK